MYRRHISVICLGQAILVSDMLNISTLLGIAARAFLVACIDMHIMQDCQCDMLL